MSRFLRADAAGGIEFSDDLVRTASGHFDVALVTSLTVSNLTIRSVDRAVTSRLLSLTTLDISRNALTTLEGLAPLCRTLVRLDASANNIASVTPLLEADAPFAALEVLRLQGNVIRDLPAVLQLARLPKLRAIYLRDQNLRNANPVCDEPDYAAAMSRAFVPRARCIDGHYFCHESVRPQRLDDGDDNEIALPASRPWVTDEFFASVVTLDAGEKFGAQSEQQVRQLVVEARQVLSDRVNV